MIQTLLFNAVIGSFVVGGSIGATPSAKPMVPKGQTTADVFGGEGQVFTVVHLVLGWADEKALKFAETQPYLGVPQVAAKKVKKETQTVDAHNGPNLHFSQKQKIKQT